MRSECNAFVIWLCKNLALKGAQCFLCFTIFSIGSSHITQSYYKSLTHVISIRAKSRALLEIETALILLKEISLLLRSRALLKTAVVARFFFCNMSKNLTDYLRNPGVCLLFRSIQGLLPPMNYKHCHLWLGDWCIQIVYQEILLLSCWC